MNDIQDSEYYSKYRSLKMFLTSGGGGRAIIRKVFQGKSVLIMITGKLNMT